MYVLAQARDMEGVGDSMSSFATDFAVENDSSHPTKNQAWLLKVLDDKVPRRWYHFASASPGHGSRGTPCITRDFKRLCRRKDRWYRRYTQTKSTHDYTAYKNIKRVHIYVHCIEMYSEYVNNIVMDENHKPKCLWSVIKRRRTDACGMAALKQDGFAYSDARWRQIFWDSESH